MKKIVVSQRIDFVSDRDETRDSIDQRLLNFIAKCDLLPIPIPNNTQLNDVWINIIDPDGIILSGGNNIGEYVDRDNTERKLLKYAYLKNIPVLGICRGMQFMATENGSTLSKVDGHTKTVHRIDGEISGYVNSFHDYKIDKCPDMFRVTARSTLDNSIEAIKHKILPWEGCMWHPERNHPFRESDIIRLISLFS